MTKEELVRLKRKLSKLTETESKERDLHLRKVVLGEEDGELTGYASIDKPWLKFYPEEKIKAEVSSANIYKFLKDRVKNENLLAINYFGNKITFKELFKRIDDVAKAFLEMGIKSGDVVSLLLANTPENVMCMYALNKIGAIPNMVDLRQKEDKLVHSINSTDSKMIITTNLFLQNLDEVADQIDIDKIVVASPFDSIPMPIGGLISLTRHQYKAKNISPIKWKAFEKMGRKSTIKNENIANNELACIVHTSGTTGDPKGVVLTNKSFNGMVLEYEDVIVKAKEGDKLLCQAPPFLAYNAIMSLHLPLSLGVSLYMLPEYSPDKFADNLYKYRIEHAVAGPADWNNILNNKKVSKRDYSFLITMGSGSDKINTQTRHQIDEKLAKAGCKNRVFEGYGMTEVGSAAVTNLPYYIVDDSVGIPLPKMSMMIYDNDEDCELPYGQIGEVCLTGETIMKEYYKNPEATSYTMRLHDDGKYWIHSGDYGYINSDGNLFLKGRLKRVIVNNEGFKISPSDIENVLFESGIVSNCCVVGVKDVENGYGAIPIANVVINDDIVEDDEVIIKQLEDKCNEFLTERYRPKKIFIRKELPMTDVGKIDFRALESICESDVNGTVKKK